MQNDIKNRLKQVDALQAKIKNLRPLKKEELKQLKEYFKIGLTYSSNALEGNSLTETETKIVIEDGITIGGKPIRDHLEVIGHSEAFDYLYEIHNSQNITEENILNLHKFFYHHIDPENAGSYRKVRVIVTGSKFKFPEPNKVAALMNKFIQNIPNKRKELHPVLFAVYLHNEFIEIHPFVDGNGRVARLLMNLSLFRDGYPVTILPPVLRKDYINSLEKAHFGDVQDFQEFIINCVLEAQKEYMRLIPS
ncbi:Fic family protein [Candidatus Margulisiibacteriota bacterium]